MNTLIIILGSLGFLVLLIFCVVDLWHLKQMLKCMRDMRTALQNLEKNEKI